MWFMRLLRLGKQCQSVMLFCFEDAVFLMPSISCCCFATGCFTPAPLLGASQSTTADFGLARLINQMDGYSRKGLI